MTNKELEMVVFCAFRYALGRKTYVVSEMCEFINSNSLELPKWMLEKIVKEIYYAIDMSKAGVDMNVIEWRSLAQDIEYYLETTLKEDIVYAFQFPEDGCGGFDISQVTIAEFCKSRNTGAPFMEYVYNTKQEAIDAMIKRLEELKND